jgi:hypothetical protein
MQELVLPVAIAVAVSLLVGGVVGYLIAYARHEEARKLLQTHAFLRTHGILKLERKSLRQGIPYRIEYALGSLKEPDGQTVVLILDAPKESVRSFFLEAYLNEHEQKVLRQRLAADQTAHVQFDGSHLRIL